MEQKTLAAWILSLSVADVRRLKLAIRTLQRYGYSHDEALDLIYGRAESRRLNAERWHDRATAHKL